MQFIIELHVNNHMELRLDGHMELRFDRHMELRMNLQMANYSYNKMVILCHLTCDGQALLHCRLDQQPSG